MSSPKLHPVPDKILKIPNDHGGNQRKRRRESSQPDPDMNSPGVVRGALKRRKKSSPFEQLQPELLELILSHMDFKFLKQCRLVSKLWNAEACRVLRRKSYARLRYTDAHVVLKLMEGSKAQNLPSPFRDLYWDSFALTNPKTESLAKNCVFLHVPKCHYLSHHNSLIQRHYYYSQAAQTPYTVSLFGTLAKLTNLTHLVFESLSPTELQICRRLDVQKHGRKLHLPALKTFEFSLNVNLQEEVDFIVEVTRGAPHLRRVGILSELNTLTGAAHLADILRKGSFLKVEELLVKYIIFREDHASGAMEGMREAVRRGRMPSLKYFAFTPKFSECPYPLDSWVVSGTLGQLAPKVESLKLEHFSYISRALTKSVVPVFPALVELRVKNFDIGSYSLEKLPNLRCFGAEVVYLRGNPKIVPHPRVERLEVLKIVQDPSGPSGDGGVLRGPEASCIGKICEQFPRARSWKVSCSVLVGYCFYRDRICEIKGNAHGLVPITALELDGPCSWQGCQPYGAMFLGKGRSKRGGRGRKQAAVTGFPALETLKISRVHEIDSQVVREYFVSLTSLKRLEFYWNKNMSARIVAKDLAHMKTITLRNCCDPEFASSIQYLYKKLPSVIKCGCKFG